MPENRSGAPLNGVKAASAATHNSTNRSGGRGRTKPAPLCGDLDTGTRYLTLSDLAQRWQVSEGTIRAIPRDELPWKPFGQGLKLTRRRYHPDDVLAYEDRDRALTTNRRGPLVEPRS